jgi:exodeoxyribonuclease VII large subunit
MPEYLPNNPSPSNPPLYTVSRLNQEVRILLSSGFPLLWVEGEVSNLARPSSGHLYFTLKDSDAQVRCAMFKNRNMGLQLRPQNGMLVRVRARVGLYERRGEYQLAVEYMEESGEGALRQAFEALKKRLAAEGLFDPERKKPLPSIPDRLGVITSPTGAAIRDILSILRRRYPALPVLIYPTSVQGENSATSIAQALYCADQRKECDVLILARGGGSLEDLWAFNEETVARSIAACTIPIVSGIGHEIDFTIADFAADHRAPTPSAAAELISPDQAEILSALRKHEQSLWRLMHTRLESLQQTFTWLQRRIGQQHPRNRLQQQGQRLDELEHRLKQALLIDLQSKAGKLSSLTTALQRCSPGVRLAQTRANYDRFRERLYIATSQSFKEKTHRLQTLANTLHTISPLATLSRGYAIVTRQPDRHIVRASKDVTQGDKVNIQLAKDRLEAKITCLAEDSMQHSSD